MKGGPYLPSSGCPDSVGPSVPGETETRSASRSAGRGQVVPLSRICQQARLLVWRTGNRVWHGPRSEQRLRCPGQTHASRESSRRESGDARCEGDDQLRPEGLADSGSGSDSGPFSSTWA
nr:hypothetical protein CFP56_01033 [Quercus suber]